MLKNKEALRSFERDRTRPFFCFLSCEFARRPSVGRRVFARVHVNLLDGRGDYRFFLSGEGERGLTREGLIRGRGVQTRAR